ncbi:oligosaccharide flippase family protein [Planococcus kocurii]|uniref:oligosaccharide flippase family protein n=1 Tax=Planococcus kocurii TaxID=1374 RepID=UPI003CFED00B
MEEKINNKNDFSKQIRLGALISYAAIFFNVIIGLLYTPWMISEIGQSNYGIYTLAIALISFFTMDFGLGEAVSRFLSKYDSENNSENKKDFLGIVFKIYIVIDIIILLTLIFVFVFIDIIYMELTIEELNKFRMVFIIGGMYSLASFPFIPFNGILISNQRFIFLKFTDLFNKFFTVFTMVIVLVLDNGLYSLIIVNAIVGMITILLKLYYLLNNKMLKVNFKAKDKNLLKEIFSFSIWIALISMSQRFVLNITPTIIAALSGSIQISLFSIAMIIEGYIWTLATALNGLFLPKITNITANKNNIINIENLMIKVGRIQLIIVGLIIIGFFTMGKEFIVLWMGESFKDSYYITLFLIAPSIVILTQQIADTTLIVTNKMKYAAFSSIVVAVISVTFSLYLTSKFGAIGSSFGILMGNIIGQVIIMNYIYYKILNLNILRFFMETHFKMGVSLLLCIIFGFSLQFYFPTENLIIFMGKIFIFSLFYFGIMWRFTLNAYEKSIFGDVLLKLSLYFRRKKNVQK